MILLQIFLMFLLHYHYALADPETQSRLHSAWKVYSSNTSLFTILWDDQSESVLVGARNRVLQLDSNMNLLQEVSIGPVPDSQACSSETATCGQDHRMIDNDVTVLLNLNELELLVCGSIRGGICSVYRKNNLREVGITVGTMINDSRVALTLKHVAADISSNGGTFFVAAFDSRKDDLGLNWYLSSIDVMGHETDRNLTLVRRYHSNQDLRLYTIFKEFCHSVEYMYSFMYKNFWYLLQKLRRTNEFRLVRINENATEAFYSSVSLECSKRKFSAATATAKFHKGTLYLLISGRNLARNSNAGSASVLCAFSMSSVEGTFSDQDSCLKPYVRSRNTKPVRPLFYLKTCGRRAVAVLGTETDLDFSKDIFISLAIVEQQKTVVYFFLSATGRLFKVLGSQDNKLVPLYFVQLNPWTTPDSNFPSTNVLDSSKQNLYFLTDKTVTKFSVRSCAPYLNCQSCLSTPDPLDCVWCQNRCSEREECTSQVFRKDECPTEYPEDRSTATFRLTMDHQSSFHFWNGSVSTTNTGGKASIWPSTLAATTATLGPRKSTDGSGLWTSPINSASNHQENVPVEKTIWLSVGVIAGIVVSSVLILVLLLVIILKRKAICLKRRTLEQGNNEEELTTTLTDAYRCELFREKADCDSTEEPLLDYSQSSSVESRESPDTTVFGV